MHQHPRPPPRMASPASSPRTNPNRTNNPREEIRGAHARASSEVPTYSEQDSGIGTADNDPESTGPSREAIKKLDQIIQNFHTKAAIVILQSRMSLPIILTKDQTKKVNRWFQLETDDTDAFRDELRLWKTCGGFENRPPPLIIETYLDTSDLTSSQSLVIVDEHGKRWDVSETLSSPSNPNNGNNRHRKPRSEVILERWKIELKDGPNEQIHDFGAILPTIYKKSIVFFRSLYSTTKFVPAWRLARSLAKANTPTRVRCRVFSGADFQPGRYDALTYPLNDSENPVTTVFSLGETESPAGRFSAELSYRTDCNFRVDASESFLSSQFIGADERFFHPSIAIKGDQRRRAAKTVEVGSLPSNRQRVEEPEPIQAYGSLSTFHGDAPPRGSSPISALRAARTMSSDANSPPVGSTPSPRPTQIARPSPKPLQGITIARRPSASFQPFKAGSLSASPGPSNSLPQGGEILPPPSPQSLSRNSGLNILIHARNRSSLTAGMPSSLRGVPIVPENAVASSASSSPRPAAPIGKYISSFSHRRGKLSYGGASKVDDDQGSSGKQSLSSSSAQPGSGILAEGGTGGSSGSLQTDDDNISDFLKLLDSKRTLPSFEPYRGGEASAKRTNAQLSRFQSMRESNNALTESMSSSMLLQRSSTSSSRQLSSVPPMVAATSISTSSSPGKPVSPHTPHTPAIPSRLSANSIADHIQPQGVRERNRATTEARIEDVSGDDASTELGTNAIDIPTSPRTYYPHTRRSSSVSQQHRAMAADDDVNDLPFGIHRSISLGADDREPPSLSVLLGLGQTSETAGSSRERVLQPAAHIDESSAAMERHSPASPEQEEGPQLPRGLLPGSMNSPYRPRIGHMGGRGLIPPQNSSYSSLVIDRGSGSGLSDKPGTRFSFGRPSDADDEPLLFDMSEIGRDHPRRSLEEGRGGSNTSTNPSERFDTPRGGDSGSSSRRGSRRGWQS